MPYNLLLLPLLGGYVFVRYWNVSRIHMLRADKDRILIRSSLAGFISLILAFLSSNIALRYVAAASDLQNAWQTHFPWEYSGISFLAFLIGSLGWIPLNLFCSREAAVNRAIDQDADPLEIALKTSQDEQLPIAITLRNEKVYVGIVTHQFNPATPTDSIAILPLHSGYRNAETKRLFLPVNYARVLEKMVKRLDELDKDLRQLTLDLSAANASKNDEDSARIGEDILRLEQEWNLLEENIQNFSVVIPVDQIASIFYFDHFVYTNYFQNDHDLTESPTVN